MHSLSKHTKQCKGVSFFLLPPPPMRVAQDYVNMIRMATMRRGQDEIARQNFVYVIEACSRRLGRQRGGVAYLARVLGTQATYISQVASGYKGRNPGRQIKDKIESKFGLDADWMDREHDDSVVSWLESRVPSLPYERSRGTRAVPSGYVVLPKSKLDDFQRQIDELRSQLGSKSNSRK